MQTTKKQWLTLASYVGDPGFDAYWQTCDTMSLRIICSLVFLLSLRRNEAEKMYTTFPIEYK